MPSINLSPETGEMHISQGASISGRRVSVGGDDTGKDIHVVDGVRTVDNTATVELDGEEETIKLKENRGEIYEQDGKKYRFVKRTATGKFKYVLIGPSDKAEDIVKMKSIEPAVGSPEWLAKLRGGIDAANKTGMQVDAREKLRLPTFDSVRNQFPEGSIVLDEISGRIREIENKDIGFLNQIFKYVKGGYIYPFNDNLFVGSYIFYHVRLKYV